MAISQPRREGGRRFRRRDDWNHLELDQVVPAGGPLRQECSVLALHDLEAAPEVLRDPTCHVSKALGRDPAVIAYAAVHGQRLSSTNMYDDHVTYATFT